MAAANPNRTPSWGGLFKVAIVGAATLKGKELKETLEERAFPSREVVLLDDEESLGQLESVGDEATFIQGVTRTSFRDVDIVFFASEAAFTRQHWQHARAAGCTIVDLSYALEQDDTIPIRSPWLENESSSARRDYDLETTTVIAAHPAATMLGLLLRRAEKAGLRNAVVTLFDPVSEQGKRGMDELHQQTLNLLSFQPMPKEVFDIQVAFNLVNRYGAEAKASLEQSEQRILRHLKIVAERRELSLQVLQAPTFHGHVASLHMELDRGNGALQLLNAIRGEHVSIVEPGSELPNNVNAAGADTIQISARPDPSRENAVWLWAAADNLKIAAITAAECAVGLLATRPSGKIQ